MKDRVSQIDDELRKFLEELTIKRNEISKIILKYKNLISTLIKFTEDNVIIIQKKVVTRKTILLLHFIGRLMLFLGGRIESPDLSLEEVGILLGGEESPEITLQDFINKEWILVSSANSFRLNHEKIGEILEELFGGQG